MPALIFDCDGVLADTERDGHLPAFNQTFAELGVPLRWSEDQYADLLRIGGGKERMRSVLTPQVLRAAGLMNEPAVLEEAVTQWHRRKTEIYTRFVAAGGLPGRPGVRRIAAAAAAAGWKLAVASTSAPASVQTVLDHVMGPQLSGRFEVFAGDIVARKKPAPDIYDLAVGRLQAHPADCLVIEDSDIGTRAGLSAGLPVLVTVSHYTARQDFTGAVAVISSLGDPGVEPTRVLTASVAVPITDVVTLDHLRAYMKSVASTAVPGARPA